MAKTFTEVCAETGDFAVVETGPLSSTGTPADSVTALVRIFAKQEADGFPPYAIQIVGVDPVIPGT